MAIFESISSISNVKSSISSSLIANPSGAGAVGNNGISCFGGGFDDGFDGCFDGGCYGGFGGGDSNINIIRIHINLFGRRHRRWCC